MRDRPKFTPMDLKYTEAARRKLYDLIREVCFIYPHVQDLPVEPLPYSAEAAELSIHHLCGRWFAIWSPLEVESYHEVERRIEVLRIKPSSENRHGFMMYEV
jgi:hypothetical protein